MVWHMPQSVSVPEKTLEHWSSQLVTLEPDEDGNYRIASPPVDDVGKSRGAEAEPAGVGDGDNRLIVFLDASAL